MLTANANETLGTVSKSLSLGLTSEQIDKKVEQVEKEDQKNTDKLVKAMVGLTKGLKDNTDKQKSKGNNDKWHFSLSDIFGDVKKEAKKFTSAEGIMGHIADAKAGTLTGAILGTGANILKGRRLEKEKEESFISTVANNTEYGKELVKSNPTDYKKKLSETYKAKTKAELGIAELENKQKRIKEEGAEHGLETDLSEEDHEKLRGLKNDLNTIFKTLGQGVKEIEEESSDSDKPSKKKKDDFPLPKPDTEGLPHGAIAKNPTHEVSKQFKEENSEEMSDEEAEGLKEEIIQAIHDGIREAYENLSDEEKQNLKNDPTAQQQILDQSEGAIEEVNNMSKEDLKAIVNKLTKLEEEEKSDDKKEEAIQKEELNLEKDQNSELKQLNQKMTESEEDKLEERIKPESSLLKKDDKKEEKKSGSIIKDMMGFAKDFMKGPFKGVFDLIGSFGSVFKNVIGMIGPIVSALGPIISSAAALIGPAALVAGAGAAGYFGAKALGADKLGESIGGLFKSDEEKSVDKGLSKDEQKKTTDLIDTLKKKAKTEGLTKEEITNAQSKGLLAGINADEYAGKKFDYGTRKLLDDTSAEKSPNDDSTKIEKSAVDKVPNDDSVKIEKSDSFVEKAVEAVDIVADQKEKADRQPPVVNSPTVINAPKSISNTTQNIIRVNVRNQEPTYSSMGTRRFAY